ncbi:MAG: isoprenylcysteine carboxylmethyltransferase family protein [Burkholderiales bacterium]|nr:isoprenylcysteine carboxylmethyltransferase family protein [Burkholderiales bacterium]
MVTAQAASSVLFGLFIVSWMVAAPWAGRSQRSSPSRALRALYAAGVAFCALLAWVAWSFSPMLERLWPAHAGVDWLLVALVVAGAAWCWWARLHIGKLWSGGVLVREGHRVVDSGPYAAVRHPIYMGAFVALIPFELIRTRPVDIVFAAGFVAFFTAKASIEEGFLREQLGEAYDEYRSRVPMLLPRMHGLRQAFAR